MNTRYIIPLLLAGAVALAVRSRSADAVTPLATARPLIAAAAPSAPASKRVVPHQVPGGPALTSEFRATSDGHRMRFNLEVTNVSRKDVELAFPGGQEYDFAVLDSAGHEVYRWGSTRMFTQSLKNRVIHAAETLRIEERGDKALTAGSYVAVATVKASNLPMQQRSTLVVR